MSEKQVTVGRVVFLFFATKIVDGKHQSIHSYEENEQKLLQLLSSKVDLVTPILGSLKKMVDAHLVALNTFSENSPYETIKDMHLVYINRVGEYVTSLRRYIDIIAVIKPEDASSQKTDILSLAENFDIRANKFIDSMNAVIAELSQNVALIK